MGNEGPIFEQSKLPSSDPRNSEMGKMTAEHAKSDGDAQSHSVCSQGCKGRVLLVEDYRGICDLFAYQLRNWGYAVAEAHSAENAIQILDTEPVFEFGVFDLRLPGLSGEQLAAYCRGLDDLKRMKLIAISGEIDRLNSKLFDGYLAKPFGPEDLKQKLESVMGNSPWVEDMRN